MSVKPLNVSYLKDYLKSKPYLTQHFDKIELEKIQVKVNILSNKINLNLGQISFKNFDKQIKKLVADEITIDILFTDFLNDKISIHALNMSKGEVEVETNKIGTVFNKREIQNLTLLLSAEEKLDFFKKITLQDFKVNVKNLSDNTNIVTEVKNGTITLKNNKPIFNNFLIKNTIYSGIEKKENLKIKSILMSYTENHDYLITIEEVSFKGIENYFNQDYFYFDFVKVKDCKIKFNTKTKKINLRSKIEQNNNLFPLDFDGFLDKNLKLNGQLVGELSETKIFKILNKEKIIGLGLDMKNASNGNANGNFLFNISKNKIENLDFDLRYSLKKFNPISFAFKKDKRIEATLKEFYILGKYENNQVKLLDFTASLKEGRVSAYGNLESLVDKIKFELVFTLHNFVFENFNFQDNLGVLDNYKNIFHNTKIKNILLDNLVLEISNKEGDIVMNSLFCKLKKMDLYFPQDLIVNLESVEMTADDKVLKANSQKIIIKHKTLKNAEFQKTRLSLSYNLKKINNYELSLNSQISSQYKNLRKIAGLYNELQLDEYFFDGLDGILEANINFNAQNKDNKKKFYELKLTGELSDFFTQKEVGSESIPLKLEEFNGSFAVEDNKIKLEGNGILNGSEAKLILDVDEKNSLRAKIISDAKHNSFSFLNNYNFLTQGNSKIEMLVTKEKISDDDWKVLFKSNLFKNEVTIDFLSHQKNSNTNGQMEGEFFFKGLDLLKVKNLQYATDDILLSLDMYFNGSGDISNIDLHQFISANNNFKGNIKFLTSNKKEIKIRGYSFDFKDIPMQKEDNNSTFIKVDIDIDNLLFGENNFGRAICNVDLYDEKIESLSGKLINNSIVHTNFVFREYDKKQNDVIEFIFDDFGLFLKTVGVTDDFSNGKGILTLTLKDDTQEIINGFYDIKSFSIKNASFLARILQLASFTELLEILGNEGIPFSKLSGKFDKKNNVLKVNNTKFEGLSLGATVKGSLNLESKNIDLEGVLVPAYAINSIINKIPVIGDIVTGIEGEGIIGVEYKALGSFENPNYLINPLSLFTPGILRNLFTPTDKKEDTEVNDDAKK
ncbi:MAG: hypothetical protein CMP24_02085 [Rickettsiales bacterium]|nr:hypothetical protein [Rickettsiales bacterium]